jgi:hypothetical protein
MVAVQVKLKRTSTLDNIATQKSTVVPVKCHGISTVSIGLLRF